jgi:hypothetical protein
MGTIEIGRPALEAAPAHPCRSLESVVRKIGYIDMIVKKNTDYLS